MRALIIQHDHVSPPGPIGERFEHHGYELVFQQLLTKEQVASPNVPAQFMPADEYDVIVSMGAIFAAYDVDRIGAWLLPELDLLREADRLGVPVLGICFGGQLLATAHGGLVRRSEHPEIGWTEIDTDEPSLVGPGPWFEWHYDRWEIPSGAREVARNEYASQAFTLRRNLAVQFHPELTAETLRGWLEFDGRQEAINMGHDPDELLAATVRTAAQALTRAHGLVDAFLNGPARW